MFAQDTILRFVLLIPIVTLAFIQLPIIGCSHILIKTLDCHDLQQNNNHSLNSSYEYILSNGSSSEFCIIKDHYIKIFSSDTIPSGQYTQSVRISCDKSCAGIVFINSTVSFSGVEFTDCGGNVTNKGIRRFIGMNEMYASTRITNKDCITALAFLFFNCSYVNFFNVTMNSMFGVAVVSINTRLGVFNESGFSSNLKRKEGIALASGNLFVLNEYNDSFELIIDRCIFINDIIESNGKPNPTFSFGSLLKFEGQGNFSINESLFVRRNCGFNDSISIGKNTNTRISNSKFIIHTMNLSENNCSSDYSELNVKYTFANSSETALLLHNTSFGIDSNSMDTARSKCISRRAVKIGIGLKSKITIKFSDVIFSNISGKESGVAMQFMSRFKTKVLLVLENVTVDNNRIDVLSPVASSSGIITLYGTTVHVKGTSHFRNNSGTVIDATNSKLFLQDSVFFINNTGFNGPAIALKGHSRLFFKAHKAIWFENNVAANLGGAIYAKVAAVYGHCAFHYDGKVSKSNITFVNNTALNGGRHIFAHPIYNCKINSSDLIQNNIEKYNNLFHFKSKSDHEKHLNLSTMPVRIDAKLNIKQKSIFPGQTVTVDVSAYDEGNRHVYASVEFSIISNHVRLSPRNGYVKEYHKSTKIKLQIYAHSTNHDEHNLHIYFPNIGKTNSHITIPLNISGKCPLGFASYNWLEYCQCSKALQAFSKKHVFYMFHCYISTQSFPRPIGLFTDGWAGMTKNGKFAVSENCVVGLCTTERNLKYFYSVDESTTLLVQDYRKPATNHSVCADNLEGPLCGTCKHGFSRAFGSLHCVSCLNNKFNYWAAILLTVVTGIFFVIISYGLNLTLSTGTINGVLFYVNVVNINLVNLLLVVSTENKASTFQIISTMFISTLNANMMTPMCFSENMGEVLKTGLTLTFPYFLLLIVLLIIVISRYSTWLSNKTSHSSVQVLVTVVHVSISILLPTFVKTFSSERLYMENETKRVWLYDGSIDFLRDSQHSILAAMVVIAVLPLFSAYSLFLIFGKYLIKYSSKFNLHLRQCYEAIHAPYREGREQWFAVRLLLYMTICLLPLVNSAMYVHLISGLLIGLFLIGQLLYHPYKTKTLNILDNWALSNLAVVYLAVMVWQSSKINTVAYLLITSILLMLCTSIAILIYHIIVALGLNKKFDITRRAKHCLGLFRRKQMISLKANDNEKNTINPFKFTGSYYDSCSQLREPLFEAD